jgi:hypothetical protein
MADSTQFPTPAWPGEPPSAGAAAAGHRVLAGTVTVVAALAVSVALGLAAGLIWRAVAPRPLIVVAGPGSYSLVQPESTAYIAADAWFAGLTVAGGILCGLAGWLAVVRRYGAAGLAALLASGVAAAFTARWVGQDGAQATFVHRLSAARVGSFLHAPLTLGAQGALAFWPLAVGAVAGGIEAVGLYRERRARWAQPGRHRT